MRRRWCGRLAAALLALGALSCAGAIGPGGGECPVTLVPSGSLGSGTLLRARARFEVGERTFGLELAADAEDGELVVVGLSRFGMRLFSVVQRGREVAVEPPPSPALAPPPLAVLDALHRAFWIGAPGELAPAPRRSWRWAGERVEERMRGGRVVHRAFTREDAGAAPGEVTIDYAWPQGAAAASEITIVNPWCGYRAVLVRI